MACEKIEAELKLLFGTPAVSVPLDLCGRVELTLVDGRTAATAAFARYPLKFIVPSRVALGGVDAVWIYVITYGGGIVAGDQVAYFVDVGPGCTGVLTTQTSTKVYHSPSGLVSEQVLNVSVAAGALLALVPDPVTCFRDACYRQQQVFSLATGGSLVMVDWLTSGRRARDEVWAFTSYQSCNSIFLEGAASPLLLDKVRFEKGGVLSVEQRMRGFHVAAVIVLLGPRSQRTCKVMEAGIKAITAAALKRQRQLASARRGNQVAAKEMAGETNLVASCSPLGSANLGLIVRLVGETTEDVYKFLRCHLAPLADQLGAAPYASLG